MWGLEEFGKGLTWISDTGLRVYFGGDVEKISQEVQTVWDSFNPAYKQLSFLCNDPYTRRLYIGACKSAAVPQDLDVLDYRELNTAAILAASGTLRIGLSGKTITTDLTRKWTRWTVQANYAALISLSSGGAETVFCGGSGASLGAAAHSALYRLEEGVISGIDDDYGAFWQNSTYPTYFFPSDDIAEQLKLDGPRLFFGFLNANVQGQGRVYWRCFANRLDNNVKNTRPVAVSPDLARDRIWGLEVASERVCFAICCQPSVTGGVAGFNLSNLSVWATEHGFSPNAGWNK